MHKSLLFSQDGERDTIDPHNAAVPVGGASQINHVHNKLETKDEHVTKRLQILLPNTEVELRYRKLVLCHNTAYHPRRTWPPALPFPIGDFVAGQKFSLRLLIEVVDEVLRCALVLHGGWNPEERDLPMIWYVSRFI